MILCVVDKLNTSENLILSAASVASKLNKNFGIVLNLQKNHLKLDLHKEELTEYLFKIDVEPNFIHFEINIYSQLATFCEANEVSFLFLQLGIKSSKIVQIYLNCCRDLRIPYLFFSDEFKPIYLNSVVLPISFLEEEVEKAQFAAAFGRFCDSEISILQANDYGSKAERNVQKIEEIFKKFNFKFLIKKTRNDSFGIDKEAVNESNADLIIISASREYGLDDVIFGPKELHLIKKSKVPLLIVNPRADLYALCD